MWTQSRIYYLMIIMAEGHLKTNMFTILNILVCKTASRRKVHVSKDSKQIFLESNTDKKYP